MVRKKANDERWPDAWANDGPVEYGYGEPSRFESVPEDDTFHIGSMDEDMAAKLQRCRGCGGTQFNVGASGYATFIRCPVCGWEELFHYG